MINLVTHYRMLFAYMGLAGVLIAGIIIGVIVAVAALRSYAKRTTDEDLITELRALQCAHNEDSAYIGELESRLANQKAMMAEITGHLARAIEAMK